MNRPTGPGPGRRLQPPRAPPSFAEHLENLSTVIIDRIGGPRDTDGREASHDRVRAALRTVLRADLPDPETAAFNARQPSTRAYADYEQGLGPRTSWLSSGSDVASYGSARSTRRRSYERSCR